MNLHGKAAVLTGAARGVGRATALRLAKLGCSCLINYHTSRDDAEETAAAVRKLGPKAVCFPGSVADDAACRAMMKEAMGAFGRIDLLINNAGVTRFIPHGDLEAVTDVVWSDLMSTNVKGPFQCIRAARPHLEASDLAQVVNVASMAAYHANGSSIPYCASKAAVLNMTVGLARALAPKIRVNAVAPGIIEGEWARQGWGENYDAKLKGARAGTALGRVCTPDDVAAAILSLITGSTLVTGHTLSIDAGATLTMR